MFDRHIKLRRLRADPRLKLVPGDFGHRQRLECAIEALVVRQERARNAIGRQRVFQRRLRKRIERTVEVLADHVFELVASQLHKSKIRILKSKIKGVPSASPSTSCVPETHATSRLPHCTPASRRPAFVAFPESRT